MATITVNVTREILDQRRSYHDVHGCSMHEAMTQAGLPVRSVSNREWNDKENQRHQFSNRAIRTIEEHFDSVGFPTGFSGPFTFEVEWPEGDNGL